MDPDIKEYLRFFVRKLWFIGLLTILFGVGAYVQDTYYSTPVYQANAKIIVKASQSDKTVVDFNEINTNLLLIDTYKEVMTSSAIMEKVVSGHPQFNLNADELKGKLSVSSNSRSQVMTVSVEDPSADKAARIVNAVAHTFKQEVSRIMNVDNVSVLSEARLTDRPQKVSLGLVNKLALGIVLALLVSVGVLLAWQYLDDTINTEKDVQKYLGKPTIARISTIRQSQLRPAKLKKKKEKKETAGEPIHVVVKRQA